MDVFPVLLKMFCDVDGRRNFIVITKVTDIFMAMVSLGHKLITLQCTTMHSKCTKNVLLKVKQNSAFLVHFECIAVHCSELIGG